MVAVTQLIAHVENAIGGPVSDELGGSIAVVNAAGRHLFSCREWLCTSRATATLDLVSGASHVLLPSDFGSIVDVDVTSGTTGCVQLVTFPEILALRTSAITADGYSFKMCANWRTISSLTTPVLEVWPTPTANASAKFTLIYKAKWPDQVDDNTIVLVPQFLENLLVEFCRAFVLGWTDPEKGTLGQRLVDIQVGAVYAAAVAQDNVMQTNFGPMRNGLLDSPRYWGDDYIGQNYTVTL